MKTTLPKLTVLSLLITAFAVAPAPLWAQSTNKAHSATKTTEAADATKGAKKPNAGPFHGKLASLDKVAKTITVGKRTFQISSETKIKKEGKPATLQDGVVGEEVSGYVKPTEDGKLVATTINFGPKTAKAKTEKKNSGGSEK